jgi:anaerobic carbon-monoxide dehydrogenase iron sulfur subunit
MNLNKILFETQNCLGCRTCELVCSYHHNGIFSPSISSIKIVNKPSEQAFAIEIYREAANGHFACDGCKGLEEPLCVKYCNPLMREELRGILRKFSKGAGDANK